AGEDQRQKSIVHRDLQDRFWDTCKSALRQLPQRVALVMTMDANAALAPQLPHVGFAGQRRMHTSLNGNGARLLDFLRPFHLSALTPPGQQRGTPSDYFNALEHAVIEAAAPHYLLQPTKVNRPKLKGEALALIDLKHEIQRRMALHADQTTPAYGRPQSRFDEAARAAAKAVRAERRQHLAETAREAEAAEAAMNLRRLHAVVRRLAPRPVAPVVAVTSPATGGACQDAEEEVEVRTRALSTISDGTIIDTHSLGGLPGLLPRDDTRIDTYDVDDITKAIRNMPNYKSTPVLKMPSMKDMGHAIEPNTDRHADQPSDGSVSEI
ncbi:unnamed protein product, partial [Prorocentrum cordatum]